MTAFLSFALADLLVVVGGLAATSALGLGGRLDRALAFLTVMTAQVVVSMLIAGGLLSTLTRGVVLAVNVAIAGLLVAVAIQRNEGRLPLPRLAGDAGARSAIRQLPKLVRGHPWCSIIVGLAGAELLWRALLVYLLPPYGYDALWYH